MSHAHPKDPLHGLTLEMIVVALVDFYGWEELGRMVVIRCFNHDPSVKSSLTFLRRTPWARAKVEEMYLWMKIEAADRADEARAREVLAAELGDRAPAGETGGERAGGERAGGERAGGEVGGERAGG
jgi:uncharacterized protein (DUF2132 family)